jgi:2-(3-amino-3-carboxypropyl)histidine synthase
MKTVEENSLIIKDIEDISKTEKKKILKKNQIPDTILQDVFLNECIKKLSPNYNFEIHKTVWRIQQNNSKVVALQFPEGLLLFSCAIADILEQFCNVEVIIMGDVTYGACCIDDYSAFGKLKTNKTLALGADLLVHYGHSCLIPVNECKMDILYIFVDIQINVEHFKTVMIKNFPKESKIGLVSTIQFISSLRVKIKNKKSTLKEN